jgi:hypothetical protein
MDELWMDRKNPPFFHWVPVPALINHCDLNFEDFPF